MPLESSPEQPLPLRTVARAVADWVGRLGRIWVEGQVTQVNRRPGQSTAFLTLRDTAADVSMQLTTSRQMLDGLALAEGARVVCWVSPEVWLGRGSLQLTAHEIRAVGIGALLARIEALKTVLAAEGLFAAARKRPLPFLPRRIGLVTGRASAAERDVVDNARRRWPAVDIVVREVAVQGPTAVTSVITAMRELVAEPGVDVIVLARGGGSVEDLLPFSDEALCRAVAACPLPVVSAIGHEPDSPLIDFVADLRCSTPTDAGKRIVPDVVEERTRVARDLDALRRALSGRLGAERRTLDGVRSRPSLAAPQVLLDRHATDVAGLRASAGRCLGDRLARAGGDVVQLRARVLALSPAATLQRGYALAVRSDGSVLRSAAAVSEGEELVLRLAEGSVDVTATAVTSPGVQPTKR